MDTVTRTGTITADVSSHDTTHYSYASVSSSYPLSRAYTDSSSTTYGQVSWKTGSGAETYVYLRFDLSAIPVGATITSVSAKAKGYVNTTSSSRVTTRQMQLATGTTLKGSALTISTSATTQTFSNTGTWTRAELMDAGVRFYVKRGTSNTSSTYQLRLYGADITVNYTYEETTYSITVSNSTSVDVTANPVEVVVGNSSEIKASSISGITITDNGTDITSLFTQRQSVAESYSVTNITTTYGFELNANNFYESNNQGHANSAAVCRIDIHVPVEATVTLGVVNSAEATYDYGQLSNLDTTLTTDASADTANVYWDGKNNNNQYGIVVPVTYTVPAGDHYIYAKYFKDQYTDDGNDSLQFKVEIELNESFTPGNYWGYDLVNVQADHAIVISALATDHLYFKSNGSYIEAVKAYKKVNGSWVEQTDLTAVFNSNINYIKGN